MGIQMKAVYMFYVLHTVPGINLGFIEIPAVIITSWLLMSILAILCLILTSNLQIEAKTKRQMLAETVVMSLLNFFSSIFGEEKRARRYFPLLASFFIFIVMCNLSGLIPLVGILPGLQSPTTSVSVTLGLALVSFVSMIYYGIKAKGFRGYFKELIEPSVLMLPLNILDEVVKPLSLTLRLYGSVFADEMILATVSNMFPYLAPLPFYFISLFFGILQAGVFTILSAIYISTATFQGEDI